MNDNEVNNPLPDDVEALIDEIEVYGVVWYILGGNAAVGIFLAYSNSGTGAYSKEAREVIQELDRRFNTSEAVRREVFERAINIGAAYHEHGNATPIWNVGRTVQ